LGKLLQYKVGGINLGAEFIGYAYAYPAEIFAAVSDDGFYTVVPACTAANAGSDLPELQVKLVMYHNCTVVLNLTIILDCPDGFAAEIHKSNRLAGNNPALAYFQVGDKAFQGLFLAP